MIVAPALLLPAHLRTALSRPLGTLLVSSGKISGLVVDYSVGDVVSANQISRYKVVDGRVMRGRAGPLAPRSCDVYAVNPPGSLSLNTLTISRMKSIERMCILGEEDLVVLGVGRSESASIAYGQPRTGVVVYEADPLRVVSVIKAFKPCLIVYSGQQSNSA